MSKISIVTVDNKKNVTQEMENNWLTHLTQVDDPRTIFQTPAFFFNSAQNNQRVSNVFAYMIYQDDKLIGLLTFIEQHVTVKVSFGLLKLLSTKINEIRSVGSGIVTNLEHKDELIEQITEKLAIKAKASQAQILLEASEERDLLFGVKANGLKSQKIKESMTFLAKLEPDFDLFLKAKTKRKRQSINKDIKRFEKAFPDRFTIKHNQDNFIEDAKTILNNSWKKGLVGSIVGSVDFKNQYELLKELKLVETFVLEVDDSPIAFAIGYRTNQHFFYEEIAYDEHYANSGVGSYLTINVVKHLHNDEDFNSHRYFSFGVGDNIYKRKLYNDKYLCEDRVLAVPYSKASIFLTLKYLTNKSYQGFRGILLKVGLHKIIRQKLKQRSIKK